ncbi:MAG: LPXTG cell wall anchor domain-containing protein, partial [Agathobacter sp.]|nr:LPXTG cell wall anchor domain-containing protein [Agathobacter sp.]
TLKVPSSLINSNSSVTRTYQMIRVHDGVATVIPCTYNAANQTISCETDQFSTYALAYVDQQNNDVKVEVPKTGDVSNAYIWFILALVIGIGALYLGKKGLVLKKEN